MLLTGRCHNTLYPREKSSSSTVAFHQNSLTTLVFVLCSGSVLLNAWRRLSTPNLASVLDVRRGVWVRGGVELSDDDPRRSDTCDRSTTIVSCSHMASVHSSADPRVTSSCQSNESHSAHTCGTLPKCCGVVSNSGIMSRSFAPVTDHTVGLASILAPNPPYPTSCRGTQPDCNHGRSSSCSDLEANDLRWEGCQCQKVIGSRSQCSVSVEHPSVGTASFPRPDPKGHHSVCCQCQRTILSPGLTVTHDQQRTRILPDSDPHSCCKTLQLNDLSTARDLPRPSNDLPVESDLPADVHRRSEDLNSESDKVGTPSFRGRSSPFCCSYSRPHASTSVCSSCSRSLYHELQPYVSDDDADSCIVTTDDEFM